MRDSKLGQNINVFRGLCILSNGQTSSHLEIIFENYKPTQFVNKNGWKWKMTESVILPPPPLVLLTECEEVNWHKQIVLCVNLPKKNEFRCHIENY